MIAEAEKAGILDFLDFLKPSDLFALADVITRRLIKIASIKDAKDGICFYASSASDVLHRQKITKQLLFDYLYTKRVYVDPNGLKGTIVTRTLEFWKQENQSNEVATPSNTGTPLDINITTLEQMGVIFGTWFYQILNSVHPVYKQMCPSKSDDVFSTSHFSPECQLLLTEFNSAGFVMSETSQQSANECFQYLSNLVLTREIFFQPNLGSGVQAKQDVHGLVQIVLCGTVYHQNTCIGVFEQVFGLVRDLVRTDIWKIQFTKLNMRHNSTPLEEPAHVQSVCN
uniref:NTF2 domain-containing protein n=1 Tax=Strigamia maritima TaxID=126957 RepID=T1JBB7_STRMM